MPESRMVGAALPSGNKKVGLPARPFLYTLDQLASLLDITEHQLKAQHIYFERRTIGVRKKDMMIARNIAPAEEKPDWRVADREFIRWMRVKGFRFYEAQSFPN